MCAIDNTYLSELFPQEKGEAFFQNQYFGTTDAFFDITLVCEKETSQSVDLLFELHQRHGHSLSQSYCLGKIFACNPDIDAAGIAAQIAQRKGWKKFTWKMGMTRELSNSLHGIPFTITEMQCRA